MLGKRETFLRANRRQYSAFEITRYEERKLQGEYAITTIKDNFAYNEVYKQRTNVRDGEITVL